MRVRTIELLNRVFSEAVVAGTRAERAEPQQGGLFGSRVSASRNFQRRSPRCGLCGQTWRSVVRLRRPQGITSNERTGGRTQSAKGRVAALPSGVSGLSNGTSDDCRLSGLSGWRGLMKMSATTPGVSHLQTNLRTRQPSAAGQVRNRWLRDVRKCARSAGAAFSRCPPDSGAPGTLCCLALSRPMSHRSRKREAIEGVGTRRSTRIVVTTINSAL